MTPAVRAALRLLVTTATPATQAQMLALLADETAAVDVRSFFEIRIINNKAKWTDAFVPIFGPANENLGYGPASDTLGVFFGRSDIVFADTWKFDPVNGLSLTEAAGGRYIASRVGAPPGTYVLTWNLLHSNTGIIERGTTSIAL